MAVGVDMDFAGPSDPFAEVPRARTVAVRFAMGLAGMIATLTLVGVVITKTSLFDGLRDWDATVSSDLADSRSSWASDVAQFLTKTGDTLPILGLMAVVTAVLGAMRKWRGMLFVPMAMLAEITTFLSVNHLVRRDRPDVERLGPLPGTYSFPSGHIAATFVCWVGISIVLVVYGRRRLSQVVMFLGVTLAVAMGWSRVYVGMHYTTDVIAGLVMGIAALSLASFALGLRLPRRAPSLPGACPAT